MRRLIVERLRVTSRFGSTASPVMKATLVGSTAILLWSSLALLTAASGRIPPFELAALAFAVGASVGLVLAAARDRLWTLRQPPRVWALGVGGLFGYHALYFAALRLAPPAQAGLIAYLWPLLIVVLSASLAGERLRRQHIIGAILGFAGVVTLIAGQNGGFHPEMRYVAGYGLALACAVVWAIYSVASRGFKQVPTETVAGFCAVTAMLAALCHILFETTVWPASVGQAMAVVGLGIGPVGLAFYVWDHGVKKGDIRLLGVASYAAPVLSTMLLVATGYASPTLALGIACAMIVAGATVATMASSA
jgi:drug/metabolite transporter (DMT)-like permease